nr:hypothetical protein CFP56_20378 [Quercus suber]
MMLVEDPAGQEQAEAEFAPRRKLKESKGWRSAKKRKGADDDENGQDCPPTVLYLRNRGAKNQASPTACRRSFQYRRSFCPWYGSTPRDRFTRNGPRQRRTSDGRAGRDLERVPLEALMDGEAGESAGEQRQGHRWKIYMCEGEWKSGLGQSLAKLQRAMTVDD